MTMKLFIKNQTKPTCGVGSWVHEHHETDMVDFLMNHPEKTTLTTVTSHHEGVDWFEIELTSDDVKTIKETSWYHNLSWDIKDLEEWIITGATIEVISIVYVPNEE